MGRKQLKGMMLLEMEGRASLLAKRGKVDRIDISRHWHFCDLHIYALYYLNVYYLSSHVLLNFYFVISFPVVKN